VAGCEALRKSIAGSELVIIPGAGHSPHEEAPPVFNEKLAAFLARVYGE
jgi:pimeloyl-ACP methyl ester carboxylesterase